MHASPPIVHHARCVGATGVASILPAACTRDASAIASWAPVLRGQRTVLYCQDGGGLSRGAAAWLRDEGIEAEILAGGFEAWIASGQPILQTTSLPPRDNTGATVWVTRVRPKIIRIACPWLIRRFVDPDARFLFVPASEVEDVAVRYSATPFDTGHGIWNDADDRCTFDVMLRTFGLETIPLQRLAVIIRGADMGRLDSAPQSAGLVAASLGLSRMYRGDVTQLDAAMTLYDSFYR